MLIRFFHRRRDYAGIAITRKVFARDSDFALFNYPALFLLYFESGAPVRRCEVIG